MTPDNPASVRLAVTPKVLGYAILAVSIPDDFLSTDNCREHIIEVSDQYRVLIVENQPGESRLIQLALEPIKQVGQAPRLEVINKLDLNSIDLPTWDAIVLVDLPRLGESQLSRLEQFVRQGGSLVALLGPQTQADAWLSDAGEISSLLGFQLTQPTPIGEWTVDPLDYRSPIVAPFAGFPDSGLLTTPIFRLWQIGARAADLEIDLATTVGQPLLVRHRLGDGMVASLLSAPQDGLGDGRADRQWNALAVWPSFLPLMQQLLQVTIGSNAAHVNLLAGEALQGNVQETTDRATLTIERPDGTENQIATVTMDAAGNLPWTYTQTETRGVYRVRSTGGRQQSFAVNVDPIESGLESIDLAELPKPASDVAPPSQVVASTQPPGQDHQLARFLLSALFAMLIGESLLAWLLGRRSG
ncbi:MAG: hypothetical protein R3C53_13895 [Pirellulaceae bacterium]